MTPSVGFCCNNCVYCWRTVEYSAKNKFEPVDDPKEIVEGCVKEQRRLLTGLKGYEGTNQEKFLEAQDPQHFAISLSGEPTMYPKLNELIRFLHSEGKTTFIVTNGMLPEVIDTLEMPTQLYLSINSPNKDLFEPIHKPLFKDGWDRLNRTLDIFNGLKGRTTIRVTLIKGMNMIEPENWARLIEKASPMFVEVKGYMFVGSSRQRLSLENMPYHEEVKEFSEKIAEHSSYKIIDEKPESRVVLMMKKDRKDRVMQF